MAGVFKVDGVAFTRAVVDKPKRKFKVIDGENAGRLMKIAKMDRDVLGTFYNYTVTIDASFMTQTDYDNLYDILSAPVNSHQLEIPYAQSTLVFEAYVTDGDDELLGIRADKNYWGNLVVNFIAMEPQRRPSNG